MADPLKEVPIRQNIIGRLRVPAVNSAVAIAQFDDPGIEAVGGIAEAGCSDTSPQGARRIVHLLAVADDTLFLLSYRDKKDQIGANVTIKTTLFESSFIDT